MNSLTAKALIGFVKKLLTVSLLVFVPGGLLDFWEGWLFLIVYFTPQLLTTIYLLKNDHELMQRRLKGGPAIETRVSQKVMMSLVNLFLILTVLVPAFDHRLGWSSIPPFIVIGADIAVLLGFLIQFQAFRENSFASQIVAIFPEQKVISTGPYGVVRHPMYSGALIVNLFTPLALGSWWGLPFALAWLILIILRLLDEEKLLTEQLPGYEDYCQKVHFRFVPHIW